VFLRQTEGPIEIEALGMRFKGAAGQVVLGLSASSSSVYVRSFSGKPDIFFYGFGVVRAVRTDRQFCGAAFRGWRVPDWRARTLRRRRWPRRHCTDKATCSRRSREPPASALWRLAAVSLPAPWIPALSSATDQAAATVTTTRLPPPFAHMKESAPATLLLCESNRRARPRWRRS
jgi:hypothetical protein